MVPIKGEEDVTGGCGRVFGVLFFFTLNAETPPSERRIADPPLWDFLVLKKNPLAQQAQQTQQTQQATRDAVQEDRVFVWRMEDTSDEEVDSKVECKPLATKPRSSKTVVVAQPSFDDDLVVPKAKKAKVATPPLHVRLAIASKSTIHGVVERMESMDFDISVYPLNYALKFVKGIDVVRTYVYRGGSPAENYNVDEKGGGWEPGKAELDGFAILAWDIAEAMISDDRRAVIVVSDLGGDAAKLLAGCAAQATRRLASKDAATRMVGSRAIRPSPKAVDLLKIYTNFASWTKIQARGEISK